MRDFLNEQNLPDGVKLRGDINVLLLGDPSTAKSQVSCLQRLCRYNINMKRYCNLSFFVAYITLY